MNRAVAFLGIAAVAVACGHKPPPPPPEPPPPPKKVEATPLPPPPAPKCEALTENCTAKSDTRAHIKKSAYSIAPPEGWTYAQQDDATVATTASALFAITTHDAGADAKAAATNRDAAFDLLVKQLGVTTPKHKVTWARPAKTSNVGDLKMQLWQADNVTKGDKKGPILVFGAQLPDKSWLLGAGFVADDDSTDADKAILKAIDSISTAPASQPTTPAAKP